MKRSTKIRIVRPGALMLFYRAALPLSSQTLTYTAGVIRRHRRQIGSCWRKLAPGRQGLLVLAYLRKGESFAELAAGFGVGTATAWRYATETVALLAARSPNLPGALRDAKKAGYAYVVIDGTLIPIDRAAADRPFYSGKHRRHGMNLQVISAPDGQILWVSGPLPGAVHDLTTARIWGILRELAASGLVVLADKGYAGAGDHVRIPTGAAASPPPRRTPTAPMPSYAAPASAPTPSSKPGGSCANSAAAPGAPGNWPKPSTSFKPAKPEDEKGSVPDACQNGRQTKVASGHPRTG
jgi:DDE superfamily endonuclease/Helix-turn-helix of DDE superfamily endonuclease